MMSPLLDPAASTFKASLHLNGKQATIRSNHTLVIHVAHLSQIIYEVGFIKNCSVAEELIFQNIVEKE